MSDPKDEKRKNDFIGDGSVKKIRCQEPDIVVAVGRGDGTKEYHCYTVLLGFASEYFDAMLSTEMKEKSNSRIEFPDKDPAEWEMFYSFLDPATSSSAKITKHNLKILLAWFHEFQMESHIKECEENVITQIRKILTVCVKEFKNAAPETRKQYTTQVLDLLVLSDTYNLDRAKMVTWMAMGTFLNGYYDVMDYQILAQLLTLLRREESKGLSWPPIRQFLPQDFDLSKVNDSEGTNYVLVHLLLAGMKQKLAA